jgi:hypothetical protein
MTTQAALAEVIVILQMQFIYVADLCSFLQGWHN